MTLRLPSGRRAATQGSRRGARSQPQLARSRAAREPDGRAASAAAPCARFAARSFVAAFAVALRRTVRCSRRRPPLAHRVRGLSIGGLIRFSRVTWSRELSSFGGRTSSARLGGGTSPPTRRPGAPSPRVPPLGACRARRAKRGAVSVAAAARESPNLSALRHVARTAPP